MIINHNMNAMNANRNMAQNVNALGKSTEKLSSGFKINKASINGNYFDNCVTFTSGNTKTLLW